MLALSGLADPEQSIAAILEAVRALDGGGDRERARPQEPSARPVQPGGAGIIARRAGTLVRGTF